MKFVPTCIFLGIIGMIAWDTYAAPPGQSILSMVVTRVLTQAPAASPPIIKADSAVQSIAQLRNLSELATVSSRVVAIADAEASQNFWILGNQKTSEVKYLMVADVKVGVDLAAIAPDAIQVTDQAVTIQLPSPKVLSRQVDETQSQAIALFELINNKDLEQTARQNATIKIEEEICKSDLFKRSNQQAVVAVTNLLQAANPGRLITIKPGPVPSCQAPANPSPTPSPTP